MKPRNIIAWVLQGLLALAFLLVGAIKLGGSEEMIHHFTALGYPAWATYVIGAVEVAGGIALLIPRFTRPAALVLAAVMVGAVGWHLFITSEPAASATGAAVLLVLLLVVYFLRRPQTAAPTR
jgi:uncharacterized membrane protein YphA (DoxX/SURF4 family)